MGIKPQKGYALIKNLKGIKSKFNRDLTAYDLFNEDVYDYLKDLFLEAYKAIPKYGQQCFFNKSENVTPIQWVELLVEQGQSEKSVFLKALISSNLFSVIFTISKTGPFY